MIKKGYNKKRGGFLSLNTSKTLSRFPLNRKSKKAQSTLSFVFGLIFSIFLIIIFIATTFVAIKYFLDIGKCTKVGQFYEDFQYKINDAWKGSGTSEEFKIELPSKIKKICFANLSAKITSLGEDYEQISLYEGENANLFLIPIEEACEMPYKLIKNIELERITKDKNPYCITATGKLKIKKDIYDKFVFVE